MPPRAVVSRPPSNWHQCEAVRNNSRVRSSVWLVAVPVGNESCVRRSVRSTAARTRRTCAAGVGSSCAAALAAVPDDRSTAGEPRPVVSGSCALGSGFAVSDIDDVVDFCKSDLPFGALCSAPRPAVPDPHLCPARPDQLPRRARQRTR